VQIVSGMNAGSHDFVSDFSGADLASVVESTGT
jgi:hypothetical protein